MEKKIISFIKSLNLDHSIDFNVNFSSKTWFGTGGEIACLFKPKNENELSDFLKKIPFEIKIFPIGLASNLLIHDDGVQDGVVLRFIKFNELQYDFEKSHIICGTGVLDKNLAKFAAQNSIKNFEFLYTIPGSVGGAIAMNAGCFGGEIKDILIGAYGVDRHGILRYFSAEDFNFSYRSSDLKNIFFTKAIFHAEKSDEPEKIFERISYVEDMRNSAQPKSVKTGGSTFKNPSCCDKKAWELIDSVALRGFRIGGAHFCQKHCNFIINDQSAKSEDIKDLIDLAQKRVFEESSILLKPEIVMLGFD